jgi:FkbM family methyltransferase
VGIGARLIATLESLQTQRRRAAPGAYGAFHRSGGDRQLVEDLPLSPDDLVIDAGGFKGAWTNEILCRYGSRVKVFEPVPAFAEDLRKRFSRNPRVEVFQAALANRDGKTEMAVCGDGSSMFRAGRMPAVSVPVCDIARVIRDSKVAQIGCLKLNIEGGEFDVLERLIAEGSIRLVRVLLVQFHRVAEDSEQRRQDIQRALTQTHESMFDFPFVWEGWRRKLAGGEPR